MKKQSIFWWIILIVIIISSIGFYHVNQINYLKHREIRSLIVEHPEKLPESNAAKLWSFGFMSMTADMYWLQTIQYIWGNVVWWEYKKYLAAMMNLITDLNPYFESPYTIGQLLLPSSDTAYDEKDPQQVLKGIHQGEELWLKWVENFCDLEKVSEILKQDDLNEIINNPKYSNPCKSYKIPYYLAYIYYFYLSENTNAANYYKVVSAQDDAPSWARILAAIMQGKWGEREKSLYMFLSLAKSTESNDEACVFLSSELERVYTGLKANSLPLTGNLIRDIEEYGQQVLPELTEENENTVLDDTKCTNFLGKAIREINLMYIEQADAKYIQDNPDTLSARSPKVLLEWWYIDFIPTDYQQYSDQDYGIIYRYNEDIWRFDYEIWNY